MQAGPAAVLCSLFLSVSGALAAPPAPKDWTTAGWKARLPSDWTLATHKKGDAEHLGRWRFASPNGNFKLSIRVASDAGGDHRALAERNLARLGARLTEQKVHAKEVTADGYVLIVEGQMLRKSNRHLYLTYRSLTRDVPNRLHYTVTLSATGEKMGGFTHLVQQITQSFEPVAPIARAKQGE